MINTYQLFKAWRNYRGMVIVCEGLPEEEMYYNMFAQRELDKLQMEYFIPRCLIELTIVAIVCMIVLYTYFL